ncbi:TPA: hypothetical protein ACLBAZ_000922, partial [Neisseria meningitidis]
IRRYLVRKQPKSCVWVSAVGRERNFAKVSACKKEISGFHIYFLKEMPSEASDDICLNGKH